MEEEKKPQAEEHIKALARTYSSKGQSSPRAYVYGELPERCYCHVCGHVLESPGKHCKEIKCPKCGARMWRVPG